MKACCRGCGFSGVPRPSMVVTLPFAAETATEHAPHCARPQPNFGPFRFSSLRNTYSSGVSGAAATSCSFPLTVIVVMAPLLSVSPEHRRVVEARIVVHRRILERLVRLRVLRAQRE